MDAMTTTTTAYHGGFSGTEDAKWFTTDRRHAASFGPVTEVELDTSDAIYIDATKDSRLADLCGWEADEALYKIMADERAVMLVVAGWEGEGLVILTD